MERELSIIIVEDDPAACAELKAYIETVTDVTLIEITNNSYRAAELVKKYLPDAVILDLELNDGIGNGLLFLQELPNLSLPFMPYILVTTNNSSKTTYDFARQCGADFIMSKHQSDYSIQNVVEFLRMMKELIQSKHLLSQAAPAKPAVTDEFSNKHLQRIISAELDAIGISPKALGYNYLIDAILLVMQNKTSNICSTLAAKYKKTDFSIERAMQNAINRAWKTSDIDDLLLHYKAHINPEKGVPTLTEFIYYYAKKVMNRI